MPLDLDEYSLTNFKNMDDLSSNSRNGVSNSATRPEETSKLKFPKIITENNFTRPSIINETRESNYGFEIT